MFGAVDHKRHSTKTISAAASVARSDLREHFLRKAEDRNKTFDSMIKAIDQSIADATSQVETVSEATFTSTEPPSIVEKLV